MQNSNEILQKGTIVKVDGLPLELEADVPVVGCLPEARDAAQNDTAHSGKDENYS